METKILLGIFVSLLIVLSGCNSGQNVNNDPIKIGSILILSGAGATWGQASMNGIDMAVVEINKNGGINGRMLEVEHQDDQSDAKRAISAFRELVDVKGINIIIGTTWTHTGLPLVELAKEKNVLMVSASLGNKDFNEGSELIFNTWPHDSILSAQLADYVFEKGHKKVALIGAEQIWVKEQTLAFKTRFEQLGGEIVVMVEPNPDTTNVLTEALKIKDAKDVDAIVSTTDGVQVGARVAIELAKLGVLPKLPIYSITIDEDTITASQGSYQGMEYLTFLTPSQDFADKYNSKFGKSVDIGGDTAYDAVMMIAEAMKATGSTDTKAIADYMNGIKEYDGVSGHLVSDGKGAFTKDFVVMKVNNGVAVKI